MDGQEYGKEKDLEGGGSCHPYSIGYGSYMQI